MHKVVGCKKALGDIFTICDTFIGFQGYGGGEGGGMMVLNKPSIYKPYCNKELKY